MLPVMTVVILQASGCTSSRPATPPAAGGVYFSSSAGALFEQSVNLATAEESGLDNIAGFALQHAQRPAHSPQKILIGAGADGVAYSEDGGQHWQRIATPLNFVNDAALLRNGVLVASGTNGEGQGFIIRSADLGKSWDVVLTIPFPIDTGGFQLIKAPEVPTSRVVTLALDPFNEDQLYAGSSQGSIFVGEQSAKTWRMLHQLDENNLLTNDRLGLSIRDIIPSPHRAGELLLVTQARTLVRVRDGEEKEINIPRDVASPQPFNLTNHKRVFDATFVPGFPQALLVGVDDGAVSSRDGGATWTQLTLPVDQFKSFNTVAVAVSPTNTNRLFVAINNVVFRSEDAGKTWNSFSLNLLTHGITALLIDPTNASHVLAITTPIQS